MVDTVKFKYRNHRGEISIREVAGPMLRWFTTEYHGTGWHMTAYDIEKKAPRHFFLADIISFGDNEVFTREQLNAEVTKHPDNTVVVNKTGMNNLLTEIIADIEEVRKAVFADVGDEPDVYGDYDRCCELAGKMRRAIKRLTQINAEIAAPAQPTNTKFAHYCDVGK